jgi:hypothetical protein
MTLPFAERPDLLDHVGADWTVVSHTITALPGGDFMMSMFLERRPATQVQILS